MPTSPLEPLLQHVRRAAPPPEASLTDGQLVDLFLAARDEAAFAELVRRHGPMVLGVCRRVLGHAQDAEDAFQAAFLVLARKAASVVPREMVGNWLHGVAYRTALKAKSLAARRRDKERQVVEMPRPEQPDADALADLQARLDRELDRLPANYRAAVVLCDLEGKPRHEAAVQLGVPEGTLSSRLARGRRLLSRRLGAPGAIGVTISECGATAQVPSSLMVSTVKAGVLLASGEAAAAVAPATVVAITEGVLHAMFLDKLKWLMATVVVALGVGSLLVPAVARMAAPVAPAPEPVASQAETPKAAKKPPAPAPEKKQPAPSNRAKVEEVLRKSFTTKRAPRLVVETFNGAIEVKIGAEGAAKSKVVRSAQANSLTDAWDALKSVDVQMKQDGDTIHVTAKAVGERRETSRGAAVEIEAPPGSTLELRGSNGAVTVAGAAGPVTATTSNGGLEVSGSQGELRLKTTNGGIRVEGGVGKIELNTTNGSIDIKAGKAKVEVKTSNGSIRFAGRLTDGEHSFTTSNGNVAVVLPADARFRLDAQTSQGRVACRFPHKPPEGKSKARLQVSVGDNPAVALKLRTSNGSVEVRPE